MNFSISDTSQIKGIVYLTLCLVTEKYYVGIHTLDQKDYLGSGKYLNRAIKKYGRENFTRIDIDEFNSLEEGQAKERLWIHELDSKYPNGYNLNDGGEGQFNPCQDVRDRIRNKIRGNTNLKGYHFSDEAKARMRVQKLGNTNGRGNKGQIPWDKGLSLTLKHRTNIRIGMALAKRKKI